MTGASRHQGGQRQHDRQDALRLVVAVGPGGIDYGHGDWADAKLTCG